MHAYLKALPKCEHHIHIEGALMPSLLFELASRNNIALPKEDAAYASQEALLDRYNRFTSLDDFLGYYYTAMAVLQNESDFEALAWSYFKKAHEDGVVHAEVFFDPQAHLERGVSVATVVAGLSAGRMRAESELNMSTMLICCYLRHLPQAAALELFDSSDMQEAIGTKKIHGVGLDSSETPFPPELFQDVFAKSKAAGLRLTAHAGEEGPASNIATSLSVLGVERIDHGIRLADDPKLMMKVARAGTMLSVCPLSNVRLRCVKSVKELPIPKFLETGVKFSINSDDPAYFGGFILDNYCAVHDAFDLSAEQWESIALAGINGSWCSSARKSEMLQLLEDARKALPS